MKTASLNADELQEAVDKACERMWVDPRMSGVTEVSEFATVRAWVYEALRSALAGAPVPASGVSTAEAELVLEHIIASFEGLNISGDVVQTIVEKWKESIGESKKEQPEMNTEMMERTEQSEGTRADQSARDTRGIIRVLEAVGRARSIDEVASATLDTIREAFGWTYGSFWVVDGDAARFGVDSGGASEDFRASGREVSYSPGQGLVGQAWRSDEPIYVQDITSLNDDPRRAAADRSAWRSALCLPLSLGGNFYGACDFWSPEAFAVSDDRMSVFRSIARLVSGALDRVEESRQQREIAADSVTVTKALGALASAQTSAEASQAALQTACEEMGWTYGVYWARNAESEFQYFAEAGYAPDAFRKVVMEASYSDASSPIGRCASTRDISWEPEFASSSDPARSETARREGIRCAVAVPVVMDGEVVGVLEWVSSDKAALSESRRDALRSLAQMTSDAFGRIRKNDQERQAADDLRHKVDDMLAVVNSAAAGNLTKEISVQGDDAVGRMAEGLRDFLTDLRGSISSIAANSQQLAGSSEELTAVSHQMAASAEETSAQATVAAQAATSVDQSVNNVASAVEEMTASVREISKNAGDAARVAAQAATVAESTNATVSKLGESSAEIGAVIKVITTIAQQTNLLALNATIEAARAGEAGKGFAVVANEVKELAKETAKATEEISQKIAAIQEDTGSAVDAIGEIVTIIGQINDIQTTIAGAVEEQTSTTNEISRSISEAATGVSEISTNVSGVAQAADQTAQGAADTQSAATELSRMASELQSLVGKFEY